MAAERDAKIYARSIEGFALRAIARELKLAVETGAGNRLSAWNAKPSGVCAIRLGGINEGRLGRPFAEPHTSG
jgi:hypothetical protein